MKTEIIPYVGFDKVKLGHTLGQIELLLGRATDKNKETYSDDSTTITLKYPSLGIDLDFSSDDDFRLGTMTFYSNEFVINGVNLIGLNESEFIIARSGYSTIMDLAILRKKVFFIHLPIWICLVGAYLMNKLL